MTEVDELLQPTVKSPVVSGERPWRIGSQFWVAFFGGILAITVIAVINAARLGVSRNVRYIMIGIAVVALGVLSWLWFQKPPAEDFMKFWTGARDMRTWSRIAAVAVYIIFAAIQRKPDARYRIFSSGEYSSLWGAGFAAVFILGMIQPLALAYAAWMAR